MRNQVFFAAFMLLLHYCAGQNGLALPKSCEDILSQEICGKLRDAASKLKEQKSMVDDAIRAALEKHLNKTNEILNFVKEFLVTNAVNFGCDDVLTAEICSKIATIAQHFKLKADLVKTAVAEAIVSFATTTQQIYGAAVAFLRDSVANLNCEDLISADICEKVLAFAKRAHLKVSDVLQAVKEAIAEGAWGPKDLYVKAVDYLKAKISCEMALGQPVCDRIRRLADAFSVSLTAVNSVLREAIANGVSRAQDLYGAVVKFIMGFVGDEPREKRDTKAILLTRDTISAVVSKILASMQILSETVRQKVTDLVSNGKVHIDELRQKIRDILDSLKKSNDMTKRSATYSIEERMKGILSLLQQYNDAIKKLNAALMELVKNTRKTLPDVYDEVLLGTFVESL